ncbi:MAG: hypothetical protein DMF19_06980 [Verrucomicrobia bacterium]|nr:MAG: hypothetical protein DMF19_06980 [Verrucomicrobiota bacterium]
MLPFSNKTGIGCLYSTLFERPGKKMRDLTNGSCLNGAKVSFREYKSAKTVEAVKDNLPFNETCL